MLHSELTIRWYKDAHLVWWKCSKRNHHSLIEGRGWWTTLVTHLNHWAQFESAVLSAVLQSSMPVLFVGWHSVRCAGRHRRLSWRVLCLHTTIRVMWRWSMLNYSGVLSHKILWPTLTMQLFWSTSLCWWPNSSAHGNLWWKYLTSKIYWWNPVVHWNRQLNEEEGSSRKLVLLNLPVCMTALWRCTSHSAMFKRVGHALPSLNLFSINMSARSPYSTFRQKWVRRSGELYLRRP